MTPADLLEVDDLTFAYPRAAPLFSGWRHSFAPGLTWIRGANGCGKSTLLQLLGGALEPSAGTVRCGPVDARLQPLDYRRRVFWCGPDRIAFDHLTPPEYFGFVAGLYPAFDAQTAADWVLALGVEPFLKRRISELSTGTRRKVAVIAAVAAGTEVVLLDEPMAGLDRASLVVLRAELADAARRRDRVWIVASHERLGNAESAAIIVDLDDAARDAA